MRKQLILLLIASLTVAGVIAENPRNFIAHRGVNLRSTIAGENSLEAIRLAARAGFGSIETDVRLTADDSLVVMHDAALNRTCLNADGSQLDREVYVADLTFRQLDNYRLKADSAYMRTPVPLLSEYLDECRKNDIFVFIEPKIVDPTGIFYKRIIALADSILGKNNYVITSNNKANIIIRDSLGIADVPLMGILYQSTFPEIERLGNIIMAVSASRIKEPDYTDFVNIAVNKGMKTESHADRFDHFDRINRNRIDYVSTDFLAPDFETSMHVAAELGTPVAVNGPEQMNKGQILELSLPAEIIFGASYLDLDYKGKLRITLGNQTFTSVEKSGNIKFQILLYCQHPKLTIEALEKSEISRLDFKAVDF